MSEPDSRNLLQALFSFSGSTTGSGRKRCTLRRGNSRSFLVTAKSRISTVTTIPIMPIHAGRQLIAYFIDRHVFLPWDGHPYWELEGRVELKEDELEGFSSMAETGRQVTSLREGKKDLENDLFDGDEKLVGKDDEIRALKLRPATVLGRMPSDSPGP